jgi:hypothetical protein
MVSPRHSALDSLLSFQGNSAMADGWQCSSCCWWLADVLLEQSYMKHVVYACALRQLELVGHVVDALQDMEWTIEPWPQLLA